MALLLFEGLLDLAEAAMTIARGAAGAEAVSIEMGVISDSTALLSPLAASETAEVSYGSINVTGAAARTYQNVSAAYGAASLVGSGIATGAEKVWDSARKSIQNRKRKRHEDQSARKKLHYDSLDSAHIHRVIKPGRAEGLVGFPNTYTSTMHSFRPVVTT